MEFEFSSYTGRLVLNPTDFILRLENKESLRIYERVFFERDFAEFSAIGGILFIEKALQTFFKNTSRSTSGIEVKNFKESPTELSFTLSYTNSVIPKPIEFNFLIPAQRTSSANPDTEVMAKKLKELSGKMEAKFQEFEKAILASAALAERVKELEERCGDTITLPGCDYAIPTDITSLTLVRNGSTIEENGKGYFYSSFYPEYRCELTNNYKPNSLQPNGQYAQHHAVYFPNWEKKENSYVFNKLTDLSNLKYLKNLTHLYIYGYGYETVRGPVGGFVVVDFASLSPLNKLTTLVINSGRQMKIEQVTQPNGTQQQVSKFCKDETITPLNNISWIRELKSLKTVSFLGCNKLVDITPLADLPNLNSLDIRETGVKNTSFLNTSSILIKLE